MTPQDLIRAAAKIIETNGWCYGTDNTGKIVHVRDQSGIPLPLYRGDNTGQDKAKVNPGARSFSIYGALCKAMHDARGAVADPGAMWQVLQQMALTEGSTTARMGGTNYVHPVIAFNEREDMTKGDVLAFLERCAVELDGTEPWRGEMVHGFSSNDWRQPIPEPDPAAFQQVWPTEEPVRHTHEDAGTAYDPGASGHELQGRAGATVKAPVAQIKAEPAVEAAKASLPPINWGES